MTYLKVYNYLLNILYSSIPQSNRNDHQNNPSNTNVHFMIIRAKLECLNLKLYTTITSMNVSELSYVKEAMSSPNWFSTKQQEYDALVLNHTWTLTALPPGATMI